MDRTAIVLSGECSSSFQQDLCTLEVKGKPLINHVVDALDPIVDEMLVLTDSQERADRYVELVGPHVKFLSDVDVAKGSLAEALRGFEAATQKYALLVTADAPLLSTEIVDLLFDLCPGRSAVIPRWPNSETEPFHAVYRVDAALEAAREAAAEGMLSVDDMVGKLRGVRYVSTLVVQEFDPDLKTFFRVKGPVDLKRAEVLANPRKTKSK